MSNSSEHDIIDSFRSDRWDLIELLSIAILIAISVSLFAKLIYDSVSGASSLIIASAAIVFSAALIMTPTLDTPSAEGTNLFLRERIHK